MKVRSVSIVIVGLLGVVTADYYGYYKTFKECYDKADSMCNNTSSCSGATATSAKGTFATTESTGTLGDVSSTTGQTGTTADSSYTTLSTGTVTGSAGTTISTGTITGITGNTTVSTGSDATVTAVSGDTNVPSGYYSTTGKCVCVSTDSYTSTTKQSVSGQTSATESSTGFTTEYSTGSSPVPGTDTSSFIESSTGESGSTTTGGKICPCQLVDLLYPLLVVLEGTEYHEIYSKWLINIQIYILGDQTLSDQEKFISCVNSLSCLFVEYGELEVLLMSVKLDGFGYVCDLITVVSQVQVELAITETLIVLEDDSCQLYESFYTSDCITLEQNATLVEFFSESTVEILNVSTYTPVDKYILIYEKFYSLFQNNSGWEAEFANVTISGFGGFSQWYFMIRTYYLIYTLDYTINGTVDECAFLQAIKSSASSTELSASEQLSHHNYYDSLVSIFEETVDVYERLDIVMNVTSTYANSSDFNIPMLYNITFNVITYKNITIEVSVYEILYTAFFYFQYGFNCTLSGTTTPSIESSTVPETSNASEETSTASETSISTVTQTAATSAETSTVPKSTTVLTSTVEQTTTTPVQSSAAQQNTTVSTSTVKQTTSTPVEVTTQSRTVLCSSVHITNITTPVSKMTNGSCPIVNALWQMYNNGSLSTSCNNELYNIIGRMDTLTKASATPANKLKNCVTYLNKNPSGSSNCQASILQAEIYLADNTHWNKLCYLPRCIDKGTSYPNVQCSST